MHILGHVFVRLPFFLVCGSVGLGPTCSALWCGVECKFGLTSNGFWSDVQGNSVRLPTLFDVMRNNQFDVPRCVCVMLRANWFDFRPHLVYCCLTVAAKVSPRARRGDTLCQNCEVARRSFDTTGQNDPLLPFPAPSLTSGVKSPHHLTSGANVLPWTPSPTLHFGIRSHILKYTFLFFFFDIPCQVGRQSFSRCPPHVSNVFFVPCAQRKSTSNFFHVKMWCVVFRGPTFYCWRHNACTRRSD